MTKMSEEQRLQKIADRLGEIEYELTITFDNLYGGSGQRFCYKIEPIISAMDSLRQEILTANRHESSTIS